MEIENYAGLREHTLHGRPGFAYNTYLCTIPQDFDRVAAHWHEQMEVVYVKRGSGWVSVNFERLPVGAGSIVPVMPGEVHSIEGEPGVRMEYENVIFSLGTIEGTDGDDWFREGPLAALREARLNFARPVPVGTPFYDEVRSALDAADALCAAADPGYSLLVRAELLRLVHALYVNRLPGEAAASRHATEPIKAVLAEVRDHFGEPLTSARAAAAAGYSESQFRRVFKREMGQGFVSYLTEYRLAEAAQLLRTTTLPLVEVAERCGFGSDAYLVRRFRQAYGMTPGAYRRERMQTR